MVIEFQHIGVDYKMGDYTDENTGATIELVEITDDYTIDLDGLEKKAAADDIK